MVATKQRWSSNSNRCSKFFAAGKKTKISRKKIRVFPTTH